MTFRKWVLNFIVVFSITCTVTLALPIEVGTGSNNAELYIEWGDGYIAEFVVHFETETATGLGVFDIIETETTLTTVREDFGWGIFIDGISYEGHSDTGYGGGEDWWHYWVKDLGQEWISPAYGAIDRVLYDGYSDGWVYGRAGVPVPEPATIIMLSVGAVLFYRKQT